MPKSRARPLGVSMAISKQGAIETTQTTLQDTPTRRVVPKQGTESKEAQRGS